MLDNNTIVAEWYGIYGTRHIPFWKQSFFVWGAYAFAVGALCLGIIILSYKYRKNIKQLSPRAKALLALNEIRTQYLHKNYTRIFYVRLTQIVKEYLSESLGLDVYAKTDTELLAIIQSETHSVNGMSSLRPIFMHVDNVKFSVDRVEPEKMRQDADLFDCFIELHHVHNTRSARTLRLGSGRTN